MFPLDGPDLFVPVDSFAVIYRSIGFSCPLFPLCLPGSVLSVVKVNRKRWHSGREEKGEGGTGNVERLGKRNGVVEMTSERKGGKREREEAAWKTRGRR